MIAELMLMLAGHPSSLFDSRGELEPAFNGMLHPGERSTLQYLSRIAMRYKALRSAVDTLGTSSEYLSSMCAAIRVVLREYESLVIQTESRIIRRDDEMVASGSFVPLATLKAVFAEWDAPMASLYALVVHIQATDPAQIQPGRLIDLLLERAGSGVARLGSIMSSLAIAVQNVWRMHLVAYLIHGSLAPQTPFAFMKPHRLNMDVIPHCVSSETRESIVYIGRAVMTVQAVSHLSRQQQQLPRTLALSHAKMLSQVLPQDGREFNVVISRIRANISEWLWTTVLTHKDVDDAIESLYVHYDLQLCPTPAYSFTVKCKLLFDEKWRIWSRPDTRDRTSEAISSHAASLIQDTWNQCHQRAGSCPCPPSSISWNLSTVRPITIQTQIRSPCWPTPSFPSVDRRPSRCIGCFGQIHGCGIKLYQNTPWHST